MFRFGGVPREYHDDSGSDYENFDECLAKPVAAKFIIPRAGLNGQNFDATLDSSTLKDFEDIRRNWLRKFIRLLNSMMSLIYSTNFR